MNNLKMKAKAGVTLVELLVVILIVTILSVSLLPLLKPYIVKAKYAAEPIPVLADLKTKINLYQYEKNYLPGMVRDSQNKVLQVSDNSKLQMQTAIQSDTDLSNAGGDSTLMSGKSAVQTFVGVEDQTVTGTADPNAKLITYSTAILETLSGKISSAGTGGSYVNSDIQVFTSDPNVKADDLGKTISGSISTPDPNFAYHFSNDIDVDYQNLTGKRVRPNHFMYRAIYGGYQSGAYAFVVGVFGDDNGLDAGTGYAVIEIVNPAANVKYIGTWERYKTVSSTAKQIPIIDGTELPLTDFNDAKKINACWIGNPDMYLAPNNNQDVMDGITQLRQAGWEF